MLFKLSSLCASLQCKSYNLPQYKRLIISDFSANTEFCSFTVLARWHKTLVKNVPQ